MPKPTTPTDPRVEILRAAGHTEAADMLDRLNSLEPTTAAAADAEQPTPKADTPHDAYERAEQAQQAEGKMLLARLREQCPGSFADEGQAA